MNTFEHVWGTNGRGPVYRGGKGALYRDPLTSFGQTDTTENITVVTALAGGKLGAPDKGIDHFCTRCKRKPAY